MERESRNHHPPLPLTNLLQELDKLCSQEQGDPFEYERKLAAWVLLVRLDTDTFEQVWKQHGSLLQQFALDILLENEAVESLPMDSTPPSSSLSSPSPSPSTTSHAMDPEDLVLLSRYLRLLAQVTTRISPYPLDIAQRILQLWMRLPIQDVGIPVHVDIISTLEVFLFTHPARANSLSLLDVIWKQYQNIILHHSTTKEDKDGATSTIVTENQVNNNNTSSPNNNTNSIDNHYGQDSPTNCEKKDEDPSSDGQDLNIMAKTLDGILDGSFTTTTTTTTNNNNNNNNNNNGKQGGDYNYSSFMKHSIRSLHELILGIFSQEGVEDLIPVSLVASLVEFITTPPSSLDHALKLSWNEWFLTWIATRCNPSARPFHQVLLNNPKFHRMLLSHVISPSFSSSSTLSTPPSMGSKDDSTLRAMAWQALVTLVEINDWYWMILPSHRPTNTTTLDDSSTMAPIFPSTSSLGRATLLCTWIRLASGELRIQLQSLLLPMVSNHEENETDQEQHHYHHSSSSVHGGWQATALPVGHGCARLLQSVVRYLIRLADQPHIPMPMEGEALLHLRQSLEQALWTAVEYLSIASSSSSSETNLMDPTSLLSSPPSSSLHNNDRASLFHAILRLLGTLLMEVDIFDLLYQSPSHSITMEHHQHPSKDNVDYSSSASPIVILTCLKDVLPIAQDPSLLPGLVHILGDAEDDPIKQQLLIHHLAHPLLEYLDWYWQREPAVTLLDDSVAWACTCTELWAQLLLVKVRDGPSPSPEQSNPLPSKPFSSQSSTTTTTTTTTTQINLQQQQQYRRRLCLTLLTWIQDTLFLVQATGAAAAAGTPTPTMTTVPSSDHYPSSLNYLSLALGCYMTLSKDRSEPPTEHETRLVLRALQRCERS